MIRNSFVLILALVVVAILLAIEPGARPRAALAAVDCTVRHDLRIEILDLDSDGGDELVTSEGARVLFDPDPQDGAGTRSIADGSAQDDSPLAGRIEYDGACAGDYVLTLAFGLFGFRCDIVDPIAEVDTSEGPATVVFEVDDCAVRELPPTATPTATATATPSATNTPAPTATALPPTATPQPPQIIVVNPPPVIVTAPTAAPAVTNNVIRPPNTGDVGLASRNVFERSRLAAWGDETEGASWFDDYCPQGGF